MIVRKIKPLEIKRTAELFTIAFGFGLDESRSAGEIYEQVRQNPGSREDLYWQERWAAFEDDDATMMSFMVAKPLPIHFDGHHLTMTGIGGVATLPQYRRRGGSGACFKAALPDMYDNGVSFSYLFPFSTVYYRKFGYEMCCEKVRYSVDLKKIPSYNPSGGCFLLESGSQLEEDIRTVYRNWQNRYNLMVENEDYEFAWISRGNPIKDRIYTYVYKDISGQAKGFMTFTVTGQGYDRDLICSRFFFTDPEGLQGLLSLARSFAAEHQRIQFDLPPTPDISPVFAEWSLGALSRERLLHGMIRVIHVETVLRAARFKGSGSVILDIADPDIPQNHKRYAIQFADDRLTDLSIRDIPTEAAADAAPEGNPDIAGEITPDIARDAAPDIALDIGNFSRLIAGAFHPDMLVFCPSIRINTDWETFSKIFYPKPCYITESF